MQLQSYPGMSVGLDSAQPSQVSKTPRIQTAPTSTADNFISIGGQIMGGQRQGLNRFLDVKDRAKPYAPTD
ncbi:hypothetical protein FOCG_05373 [Fusarium oxysporum f. sp. radicis-lycopersici 26381]|nr:hypothetical protein FOCG_05373 [Fusarium oxysporum f. sp. radicis-lycopersici 26381]RKL49122.1 hypothetical protein BFJ70_g2054 [Fusarium oxysporum]